MAVNAKFLADFSNFQQAVAKAEVSLKSFETGAGRVEKALGKMGNSFSGVKVAQEANLMAKAVEAIGGASRLTESEQRRVNATVTEAIAKYKALGMEAPKSMLDLAKATSQIPKELSLADKAVGVLKSSFGQFTAANLAASAIQGLTAEVQKFIGQGLQLKGIETSFERLSRSAKVNSGVMLSELQKGTRGMVSNFDLMTQANKAMLLGLPVTAQSMGELAKTATVLGQAMGLDATQSLNDLITALGRSSPMILDNLGLTVKLGEANEQYAQKLGKTADSLDESEKKMAFFEAAMEAARKKTAELGEQTKTLGQILTTVWTSFGNVVTAASSGINTGLGSALSSGERFSQFLQDSITGGMSYAITMQNARVAVEGLAKETKKAGDTQGQQTPKLRDYVKELKEAGIGSMRLSGAFKEQYDAAVKLGISTEEITKRFGLSAFQQKQLAEQTKETVKAQKDLKSQAADMVNRIQMQSEATEDLNKWMLKNQNALNAFTTAKANEQLAIQMRQLDKTTQEWIEFEKIVRGVGVSMSSGPLFGAGNDAMKDWLPEIRKAGEETAKALNEEITKGLNFGRALSQNILGALQGGGDLGKSIGGFLGDQIGSALGEKLAKAMGDKLGSALGGMLGPLGALGGQLLGGLFDKLFSKEGRNRVEDFASEFGGFDALRDKLNDLGEEGDRLWIQLTQKVGRGNVQQAESAIKAIEAAFDAHKAKVAQAEQEAAAVTAKASEAQQKAIDDAKAAVAKLDSEYQSLYDSIKNEAPEDEMGIIERNTRKRMEEVAKERANAQSELERITKAMEESFDRVADAAEAAARAIEESFKNTGIRSPRYADSGTGDVGVVPSSSGGDSVARALTMGLSRLPEKWQRASRDLVLLRTA